MIKLPESKTVDLSPGYEDDANTLMDIGFNRCLLEIKRLNATAQPVRLPTTRLWAGKVDCYSKEDVISMLKSLGLEVSE